MKNNIVFTLFLFVIACTENKLQTKGDFIISKGQMPAIARDKQNHLHVVFGKGDSIMYTYSTNSGNTFSEPALIKKLPHVYAFAMRGPQIAATDKGLLITACTTEGNIYAFYKDNGGSWKQGNRINDADTVAKEGLMALNAYGNNVFAVWLDLRNNKRNKIYGAKSADGGKTWSKNILIYDSPDSTVCECCKPSVVVWKNKVAVMFRNWVDGNRDLYLAQSNNSGNTFANAVKLGVGNWKLNGCPMDGGNVVVNSDGVLQTVWRREATIYEDVPGMHELKIGEGRNCTIETVNNRNVFAWLKDGKIIITKPDGRKILPGEGSQPVLKAIDNNHIICLWENDKKIHAFVLQL